MDGGYLVTLSLIDVDVAKLVTEFDVKLDGSNDTQFQAGVLEVIDAALQGDLQQLDPQAAAEQEAETEEQLEIGNALEQRRPVARPHVGRVDAE